MNAEELISLYNALFYVGLAIAAVGLIAAVAMFFLFDIPKVFVQVTGRGGKLMAEREGQSVKAKKKEKKKPKAIERPVSPVVYETPEETNTAVLTPESPNEVNTTVLTPESPDEVNTTVLSPEGSQPIVQENYETTVLSDGSQETTILGSTQPQINFEISESLIWVHTDEII